MHFTMLLCAFLCVTVDRNAWFVWRMHALHCLMSYQGARSPILLLSAPYGRAVNHNWSVHSCRTKASIILRFERMPWILPMKNCSSTILKQLHERRSRLLLLPTWWIGILDYCCRSRLREQISHYASIHSPWGCCTVAYLIPHTFLTSPENWRERWPLRINVVIARLGRRFRTNSTHSYADDSRQHETMARRHDGHRLVGELNLMVAVTRRSRTPQSRKWILRFPCRVPHVWILVMEVPITYSCQPDNPRLWRSMTSYPSLEN